MNLVYFFCSCLLLLYRYCGAEFPTTDEIFSRLQTLETFVSPIWPNYSISTFDLLSIYYEDLLGELRSHNVVRPSRKRLRDVGEQLCIDASTSFQSIDPDNTIPLWQSWIQLLHEHEIEPSDCQQFYNYYKLEWEPRFFHWAIMSASSGSFLQRMVTQNVSEWEELWFNPAIAGSRYAAIGGIPTFHFAHDDQHYRDNRVINIQHFFSLYHCTGKTVTVDSLSSSSMEGASEI
jgi:hypothetical protein